MLNKHKKYSRRETTLLLPELYVGKRRGRKTLNEHKTYSRTGDNAPSAQGTLESLQPELYG